MIYCSLHWIAISSKIEDLHGMANEDALVQLLLLNELLDIFSHCTIVVLWGMEGLSMIAQVLSNGLVV